MTNSAKEQSGRGAGTSPRPEAWVSKSRKVIWLFGSRARGDDHCWSDIDLAAVLEGVETWTEAAAQRQRVSAGLAEIALDTDTVPSLRIIPRRIFESDQTGLVAVIKREGRKL